MSSSSLPSPGFDCVSRQSEKDCKNSPTPSLRLTKRVKKSIVEMHTVGYRVNAVLTLGVTILALICAMASLSDNLNLPSPSAHVQVSLSLKFCIFAYIIGGCLWVCILICVFNWHQNLSIGHSHMRFHVLQVLNINWFQKQPNGNDEVYYSYYNKTFLFLHSFTYILLYLF